MKKLVISIVTHNAKEHILTCLQSIPQQREFQVIVVDNESKDGTPELVRKRYPSVKIIFNKNTGFGAGHNLAIESSRSQYNLVLNPDIVLQKNTLNTLIRYLDEHKEVGCVCPKIIYPQGKVQYLCRRYPDLFTLILRRMPYTLQKLFIRRLNHYLMKDKDYEHAFEAPSVSGSFMLMRREVITRVGLFDTNFFLYFEDMDLCRRISNVSRILYYPSAVAVHDWKGGSQRSFRLTLIHLQSMISYFNKWGWRLY